MYQKLIISDRFMANYARNSFFALKKLMSGPQVYDIYIYIFPVDIALTNVIHH